MAIGPSISDIRELTAALSIKLNVDFNNYGFSFLRRRFAHIYNVLNIKNTSEFIREIKSGSILEDFCYFFPVPINEMFRDPSFWRALKNRVIPSMSEEEISFWFPELVSPEELYSLIVILEELGVSSKSRIYCNIESVRKIDEVKSGIINSKYLELNKQNYKRLELSTNFNHYFIEEKEGLQLKSDFLNNVCFINASYFSQHPEEEISVVIFRNRMLYYNLKLQETSEKYLHNRIKRGGYLSIGIKEKISEANSCMYELFDEGEQIYKI